MALDPKAAVVLLPEKLWWSVLLLEGGKDPHLPTGELHSPGETLLLLLFLETDCGMLPNPPTHGTSISSATNQLSLKEGTRQHEGGTAD